MLEREALREIGPHRGDEDEDEGVVEKEGGERVGFIEREGAVMMVMKGGDGVYKYRVGSDYVCCCVYMEVRVFELASEFHG